MPVVITGKGSSRTSFGIFCMVYHRLPSMEYNTNSTHICTCKHTHPYGIHTGICVCMYLYNTYCIHILYTMYIIRPSEDILNG